MTMEDGLSPYLKANNAKFTGSMLLADADGYVSVIKTAVPTTEDNVTITISQVLNLGQVRPLSA